jgi:predicted AlkP superfamily pyrophosphatase or phosphodiesterase
MLSLGLAAVLSSQGARAAPAPERPRLGVVMVVDQLAMMHLDRYRDLLREDGIRRLLDEGAVALDARYLGGPTVTAHGHASLATGAYAGRHGIVGNEWVEPGVGRVRVGHDEKYKLVTREVVDSDATAPTHLKAPTFADAMRMSIPDGKIISVSLKDRGAILFGGAKPTAAVWYDWRKDLWTTSTYYSQAVPSWVSKGSVSSGATAWERLDDPRICAEGERAKAAECIARVYATCAGPDEDSVEGSLSGMSSTFPHKLSPVGDAKRGRQFMSTPLGDAALTDLAIRALEAEGLGKDEAPDLLFVSASGFDLAGHDFGPESQELLDGLLRMDVNVARLLAALDEKVGNGRYVFALSADHGVSPSPHRVAKDRRSGGMIDAKALVVKVDRALDAAFGPRDYLYPITTFGLYFKDGALNGLDRAKVDSVVIEALRGEEGLAHVWPKSLLNSHLELRGDAAFYARSFFDGRSPDFMLQFAHGWADDAVADHGLPYISDSRVPLIFYRGGRAPLRIDGLIDVTTLTPTLAVILGSAPPMAAEAPILTHVVDHLR